MKINKLKSIILLALGGLVFITPVAKAATTIYSADDLFIGFVNTVSTNSYVLNIGQAALYRNAGGTINLNTANLGGNATSGIGSTTGIFNDIKTAFGNNANWATDGTTSWAVVGTTGNSSVNNGGIDPIRTLYASNISATPLDTAYTRQTSTTQNSAASAIGSMALGGAGIGYAGNASTANSPVGLIETSSYTSSFANAIAGTGTTPFQNPDFNYFPSTLVGTAANGAVLDLFRMQASNQSGVQTTGTAGSASSLLGTFNLTTTGSTAQINFNLSAVPEPSRALLLVGGMTSLFLRRRRSAAVAA